MSDAFLILNPDPQTIRGFCLAEPDQIRALSWQSTGRSTVSDLPLAATGDLYDSLYDFV